VLQADPLALSIGFWEDDGHTPALAAAFTNRKLRLEHLFIGDIVTNECELSWIKHTDLSALFDALPNLQTFKLRGSLGLKLPATGHPRLKTLIIESGGLPAEVVRQLAAGHYPHLEHLELWLGRREYGATVSAFDLEPLLSKTRLPSLRYLGLRNSDTADEVAAAALESEVAANLACLDFSLGVVNDQVGQALLAFPVARTIQTVDLSHHFLSAQMVDQLRALGNVAGLELEGEENDENYRYAAVGE